MGIVCSIYVVTSTKIVSVCKEQNFLGKRGLKIKESEITNNLLEFRPFARI
jgi:hypothetical protein